LAADIGEWERAARLYGTAEATARQSGLRRDSADETFLGPLMQKARNAIGPAAFSSAVAEGSAHPVFDEAIAETLKWLARPAQS